MKSRKRIKSRRRGKPWRGVVGTVLEIALLVLMGLSLHVGKIEASTSSSSSSKSKGSSPVVFPLFGNRENGWFRRQKATKDAKENEEKGRDDVDDDVQRVTDVNDSEPVVGEEKSENEKKQFPSNDENESKTANDSLENKSDAEKDSIDGVQQGQTVISNDVTTCDDASSNSQDDDGNNTAESDGSTQLKNNDSSQAQSQRTQSPVIFYAPSSSNPYLRPPPTMYGMPPRTTSPYPSNNMMQPPPPPPPSSTLVSVLSLIAPLLGRLLFIAILSATSSLFSGANDAHSVYSPNPTQHYMLERVNDRYAKDGLALQKALQSPPLPTSSNNLITKRSWSWLQRKRRNQLKKQLIEGGSSNIASALTKRHRTFRNNNNAYQNIYERTVIIMDVNTESPTDNENLLNYLRDAVSFILRQYHDVNNARLDMGKELEVILRVESPGGVVQDFGLMADQVSRLVRAGTDKNIEDEEEDGEDTNNGIYADETKEPNKSNDQQEAKKDIIVTICVDKIAASGGYMIACQASPNQLFAAPFALLGSIGVLRETINVHDILMKYGIRPLLLKAGRAKVPLTATAEVTQEGLDLVQGSLNRVHDAFRNMVMQSPRGDAIQNGDFEKVTSGDLFFGEEALKYGLVDRLVTSDEYIAERVQAGDRVLRLRPYDRSRMGLSISPLDLLLLKSGGLIGKAIGTIRSSLPSSYNGFATSGRVKKHFLPLLRMWGSVALTMKVIDSFTTSNSLHKIV